MNIKRLLVATDFSDASDKSIQIAIMTAKKLSAEIILLHIFEMAEVDEHSKQLLGSNFFSRDLKRQLQQTADDIQKNEGIKASFITKDGELFTSIAEAINETLSDILFIGTHGTHGVQHLTGSFLASTINQTQKPVWVIQKQTTITPYQNIFVFIDEFPGIALHELTLELAKVYHAKLHFVFSEPSSGFAVNELVADIEETLNKQNIAFTIDFIEGEADKTKYLLDMAEKMPAPLIIINRDGKGAEKHIPILTNKNHIEVVCLF